MNRKQRRDNLVPTRIHTKFIYQEHEKLPVKILEESDGRTIANIQLEGYASTKVKDGSGDIVRPEGIDLSRFENGNAPLKAMHGRGVISNIGVIKKASPTEDGLYIQAETRLDITKDKNGRPINEHDYVLYDRLMSRTINGFSIGFHNIVEEFDREIGANIIKSMTLHEISIVDVPDNPLTIIKMLEILHEQEDIFLDPPSNMPKSKELQNKEIPKNEVKQGGFKLIENVEAKSFSVDELKIGEMYRYKRTFTYGTETWSYVYNAELVKIDATDEKASEGNPMLYFLDYKLDLNGFVPTTSLDKGLFDTYEIVEVTEEQLKSLPTESQESEDSGNAIADEPENGDSDEGEAETPETEGEEQEEQKQLELLQKELEETKSKLQLSEEMLKEAQEIATSMVADAKRLQEGNEAMSIEIKNLKKAKVEHGLALTGEEKEQKVGNVGKALNDGFKMLA